MFRTSRDTINYLFIEFFLIRRGAVGDIYGSNKTTEEVPRHL